MSAVLRLYPRAWRERYGDELLELLADRPATLPDMIDLFRGAIDARLHPQVPGANVTPDKEVPVSVRLLGIVAAIGGVAWLLGILSTYLLPLDVEGNRDTSIASAGLALAMALTGVALGELGSRPGSPSSARAGHAIAGASIVLGAVVLGGWPWFILPLVLFPLLGVAAAWRGSENGATPRWLAVVFGVAAIASLAGTFGIGTDTEIGLALLGAIGVAALVLAATALGGRASAPTEARPA